MNRRIDHHLARVQRALNLLERRHVPVYGVEISSNRSRPLIHTGAGPYDWCCTAFGQDTRGPWWDYVAALNGVDLYRRVRQRPGVPDADQPWRHPID